MSFSCLISPIRRVGLMVVAGMVAAGFAAAQSAPSPASSIDQFTHSPFSGAGYSSSQAGLSASGLQLADFSLPEAANLGRPAAEGAGAGQYGQSGGSGGGSQRGLFHHLAFEAGGGFNGLVGNDTPYITWGGNFTVGAGFRFSRMFSTLLEYQFIDDKLPGAFISAVGTQSGDVALLHFGLDGADDGEDDAVDANAFADRPAA